MIKTMGFENYKAFDKGEINLKPITILLGPNSVGKSSLMQLILLLQQTSLADKDYKSPLRLNGGFVSLGENLNLMKNKEKSKILKIHLKYNNGILKIIENMFKSLKQSISYSLIDCLPLITEYSKSEINFTDNTNDLIDTYLESKKFHNYDLLEKLICKMNRKDFEVIFQLIKNFDCHENNVLHNFYNKKLVIHRRFENDYTNIFFDIDNLDLQEFFAIYDLFTGILKNKKDFLDITYALKIRDEDFYLDNFIIKQNEKKVLFVKFNTFEETTSSISIFDSDYINNSTLLQKTTENIGKIFTANTTIFDFLKKPTETTNSLFCSLIYELLYKINDGLKDFFKPNRINYVSPIRAHPQRYYFLDKAKINTNVDTLDGDSIAEVLKKNPDLKIKVNNWLKKFNLQIDVKNLKDIIHSLTIRTNSLNLDITDVGFGISQILPVIIQGFFSKPKSTTLIEQPEIHLHPQMQADLADLFIDIINTQEKKLIIETHSEYLLKRLRRRISEGVISHEDVAIYFVEAEDNNSVIRQVPIEEKGHFEWPTNFYGGELLNDITEFINNQN